MSICFVLFSGLVAVAQQGYTFKGNALGMSLNDFRAANSGYAVWITAGKVNAFGRTKKNEKMQVQTPLCTDKYRDFPGDSRDLVDDEILCNASPGSINSDGATIDGYPVDSVAYRFYKLRLYQINIFFVPSRFEEIANAFRDKYGEPLSTTFSDYQNAFGARWKGRNIIWRNGKQRIAMVEGGGNGPGQNDETSLSGATITDESLSPPPSGTKVIKDF